ncbi:putative E3 SUMO-protein ligase RNF212 [Parambassis ranga]|uniref:E3 SUMO-protein ligase RNF212 n=1 Tax=Parambassis ranga TaxID=210632 RepID=A0A6P7J6Y5_9TELE|nr:probable E3 SUMO-protein ligase RNF212 [Parambassis ranga]
MPDWVCCNSCFLSLSADRKLAVTSCGHIICNICYQKGEKGKCLTCSATCQMFPLSDKSSPDVKALFSDINGVASNYLAEICKVVRFQARHQKRLLNYYQQRNEKQEEVLVKMKQEMQLTIKKLSEQSTYINKLENSLQHQSAKASCMSQMSHSSLISQGHKPVIQIPYNSPISLSRHSSATNISENCTVDERILFKKPNSFSTQTFINPPQDAHIGAITRRLSIPSIQPTRLTRSATVSHFQRAPPTPDMLYQQSSRWKSPIFHPPASFRGSTSSLVGPPP